VAAADWLLATLDAQLGALLPACRAEHLDAVDSTSTELMRRARAGRCEPVLLVADRQTAGRGRMGRPWQSALGVDQPASLTFSLGLPLAPRDWSGLSLAVGIALAESLDPDGAAGLALKWPNDLWLEGRKLGGILIETAGGGQAARSERQLVIGVGLNIDARPATDGMSTAPAWLREWQPQASPQSALLQVAAPLLQAVLAFAETGFAPLAERFARRDTLRGRDVQLSDGRSGRCAGVGPGGELLVHTGQAMEAITSSEVSVRPRAASAPRQG